MNGRSDKDCSQTDAARCPQIVFPPRSACFNIPSQKTTETTPRPHVTSSEFRFRLSPTPRHHKNWDNLKNCLAAEMWRSAEWKCAVGAWGQGGMGAGGNLAAFNVFPRGQQS
jgi:hypothetical protein